MNREKIEAMQAALDLLDEMIAKVSHVKEIAFDVYSALTQEADRLEDEIELMEKS